MSLMHQMNSRRSIKILAIYSSIYILSACSKIVEVESVSTSCCYTDRPIPQALPNLLVPVNSWRLIGLRMNETRWIDTIKDEPYLQLVLSDCNDIQIYVEEIYIGNQSISSKPSIARDVKIRRNNNTVLRAYYPSSLFQSGARCVKISGGTMLVD